MTTIPGTDLTTEAALNIAARAGQSEFATLLRSLAFAYADLAAAHDNALALKQHIEQATMIVAIERAKSVADRANYSPQESAAAWDVVDALVQLRTAGESLTPDPDQDDRDGKQIARAAEWVGEGLDDGEADRG